MEKHKQSPIWRNCPICKTRTKHIRHFSLVSNKHSCLMCGNITWYKLKHKKEQNNENK